MGILLKTKDEIEVMRQAGGILARIISKIKQQVQPGVSTAQLDRIAADLCAQYHVKAGFLGYRNYPATACFSLNDTVVHGVPSEDEVLQEGDIISIDMGIVYKKFFSDMAITVGVGTISDEAQGLLDVTKECLQKAISQACEGKRIGDIGHAIESTARKAGYSVVRQMVGHGIGHNLHEEPQVPGWGTPGTGAMLKKGMVIAIETIINQGTEKIRFLKDGWTTKTADGKLSALFEHSVAIGKKRGDILTKK